MAELRHFTTLGLGFARSVTTIRQSSLSGISFAAHHMAIFQYSQSILAGELRVLEVGNTSVAKLFEGAMGVAHKAGDKEGRQRQDPRVLRVGLFAAISTRPNANAAVVADASLEKVGTFMVSSSLFGTFPKESLEVIPTTVVDFWNPTRATIDVGVSPSAS
jgi:hypothetical protein